MKLKWSRIGMIIFYVAFYGIIKLIIGFENTIIIILASILTDIYFNKKSDDNRRY